MIIYLPGCAAASSRTAGATTAAILTYVCVCMCIHIYIYMYVYIDRSIDIDISLSVYIYIYTCICLVFMLLLLSCWLLWWCYITIVYVESYSSRLIIYHDAQDAVFERGMNTVVGYSLGAAVNNELADRLKQVTNVRMYNSPTITNKNSHVILFILMRILISNSISCIIILHM